MINCDHDKESLSTEDHSKKQIAMVIRLSRSQVKRLLEKGEIELKVELPQSIFAVLTLIGFLWMHKLQGVKFMEVLFMQIKTQRLLIRNVRTEDAIPFAIMAADGSLNDCGFDRDCGSWITKWIAEAKDFALRDDPNRDYLAYTITLKDEAIVVGSVGCSYYEDLQEIGITYFVGAQYRNNGYAVEAVRAYTKYFLNHYHVKKMIATVRNENIPSRKVIEKAGFILTGKRMYKDLDDDKEKLYCFYEIKNNLG